MSDTALPLATMLVKKFEGCRLTPYEDSVNVWTIGYGNIRLADGSRVCQTTPPLTQGQAESLMRLALAPTLAKVRTMARVPLEDHEAAALASFAYNLGTGALGTSTLLRLLNLGDRAGAAGQFQCWIHAGGRVLPGLVTRRAAERDVFLGHVTV